MGEVFHSPRDHSDAEQLPAAPGVPPTHLGQSNVRAPLGAAPYPDRVQPKQVGLQGNGVYHMPGPVVKEPGLICSEELSLAREPSPDAVQQADGSFLVTNGDGSTVRWTRRPGGEWRKPEHKRAGWAPDLLRSASPSDLSSREATQASTQGAAPGHSATEWLNGQPEAPRAPAEHEAASRSGNGGLRSAGEWLEATSRSGNGGLRSTGEWLNHGCAAAKESELARREEPPAEPPADAVQQADGSFVLVQGDGSTVRWTRRPDGAWRKPELKRPGWSSFKAEGAGNGSQPPPPSAPPSSRAPPEPMPSRAPPEPLPARASPEPAPPRAPPAPRYEAPETPPERAVLQEDGTFLLELEDGSTVKWSKRPNGTWRKPEHKKAGWVGDLEREKYVIPAIRDGEHLLPENLLPDPDYLRTQLPPARANAAVPKPDQLASVLKMMQMGGWQ